MHKLYTYTKHTGTTNMTFEQFSKQFHSMHRQDPKFKELCQTYPVYAQRICQQAWQQIAKIRERKNTNNSI